MCMCINNIHIYIYIYIYMYTYTHINILPRAPEAALARRRAADAGRRPVEVDADAAPAYQ